MAAQKPKAAASSAKAGAKAVERKVASKEGKTVEARALTAQQMRVMGKMCVQPFDLYDAQSKVSPTTALALTAVFAAISNISRDLARVPLCVYKRREDRRGADLAWDHPLNEILAGSPDGCRTSMAVRQTMAAHCLGYGNAVAEIERSRDRKTILGYHPIHPAGVEAEKVKREDGRPKIVYHLNGGRTLEAVDVIHYHGLTYDGIWGVSPIQAAATNLAVGMSADAYTLAFFSNGSIPSGFIRSKKGPSPEVEKAFRKSWGDTHGGVEKAHRIGLLFNDAEFVAAQINPIDAQLLEARKYSVADVARIYQIPLTKLMEWTDAHFSNYEESQLDYVVSLLAGWFECIEQAYSLKLLTPVERAQGYYLEHDMRRLYRGNFEAMAKANATAIQNGYRSPDEVREENGDPPIADGSGGRYFIQKNMMPLDLVDKVVLSEARSKNGRESSPAPNNSAGSEGGSDGEAAGDES